MMHTTARRTRQAAPDRHIAAQTRCVLQGDLRALAIPPQEALRSDPASAEAPAHGGRLGDYLLSHGLIAEPDLAAALAEQRRRLAEGAPIALGDLLVAQGRLSVRELVRVLMLQQLDRLQGPATDTPPLGELLVRAGLITAAQLAAALTAQTESRQRGETRLLGEILIEHGALAPHDLAATLESQRR